MRIGSNDDKAAVRRELRRRRWELPAGARATEQLLACQTLSSWLADHDWPPVASYVAVNGEFDLSALHDLLWESAHRVLLPRVDGPHLRWYPVAGPDDLHPGYRDIPEPDPERVRPLVALPRETVLLLPGVGFDRARNRLGQGGGFYDRVLASSTPAVRVGVGFACQLLERLPCEAHDQPVDRLLIGGEWVEIAAQ